MMAGLRELTSYTLYVHNVNIVLNWPENIYPFTQAINRSQMYFYIYYFVLRKYDIV